MKSFNYAVKKPGVNKGVASKALHQAKHATGRKGADNVPFDPEAGDIISPEAGDIIGNLLDGC